MAVHRSLLRARTPALPSMRDQGCVLLQLGLNPLAMLANQIDEPLYGFTFGNVEFDRRLSNVEVDLARRSSDVAEIRVRHFAGSIHDATHDGDLHPFEMFGARLDPRRDRLQVKQCAPA